MNKKLSYIILGCLVSIALYWHFAGSHRADQPPSDAIYVKTAHAELAAFPDDISAMGSLSAPEVVITPEISGHVRAIHFKDGDKVKKGDVILELDDSLYQSKLTSAQLSLDMSKKKYDRLKILADKGVISKQSLEQAEVDVKNQIALLTESHVLLNKSRVTAPFNGVLGEIKISVGDFVTEAEKLVTLTDLSQVRVEYNVPDLHVSSLSLNQPVNITTPAYPGEIFLGHVSYISSTVAPDTRTIHLNASISDSKNKLLPGMYVNLRHQLTHSKHVLSIPLRSMTMHDGEEGVYHINQQGKANFSPITIGRRMGDRVEVLAGVKLGDEIVTDGQLKLKNGSSIHRAVP